MQSPTLANATYAPVNKETPVPREELGQCLSLTDDSAPEKREAAFVNLLMTRLVAPAGIGHSTVSFAQQHGNWGEKQLERGKK